MHVPGHWVALSRPDIPQTMDAAALLCDSMHKKRRKVVQTGDPCSICFLLTSLLILFHSFSIHFLLIFYSFSTPFYSFPTPLWGDEKSWKIIGNRAFSNSLLAGPYKGMLKSVQFLNSLLAGPYKGVFKNCKISEFFKPTDMLTTENTFIRLAHRLTSLRTDASCKWAQNMKKGIKEHEKS